MRELVCGLYIAMYTLLTAPARYINTRKKEDPKALKAGQDKNYKLAQTMAKGILKLMGARLHIEGEENLLNKGTCVYMGTHKSYIDILILLALVEEPLTFIGKAEVDKIPFIGTWFHSAGGIPMERENIRQSFEVILKAIEELKEGHSVAIFPEGTRAKGREMGEFKAGSFKLATRANVPIVPIAMQDTFKLLEEKRRVQPTDVYIKIGETIDVPNLGKDEKKTIAKDTEKYMKQLLDEVTM